MLRERIPVSKYFRIINCLALGDKELRGLPFPQLCLHLHVYQCLKKSFSSTQQTYVGQAFPSMERELPKYRYTLRRGAKGLQFE